MTEQVPEQAVPERSTPDHEAADHEVALLEFDETVPPRPEEEVADAAREPDV